MKITYRSPEASYREFTNSRQVMVYRRGVSGGFVGVSWDLLGAPGGLLRTPGSSWGSPGGLLGGPWGVAGPLGVSREAAGAHPGVKKGPPAKQKSSMGRFPPTFSYKSVLYVFSSRVLCCFCVSGTRFTRFSQCFQITSVFDQMSLRNLPFCHFS